MSSLKTVFIATLMLSGILYSQQIKTGSLVVLPFYAKGIEPTTVSTAAEILRLEMENLSAKNISMATRAMLPHNCFIV